MTYYMQKIKNLQSQWKLKVRWLCEWTVPNGTVMSIKKM